MEAEEKMEWKRGKVHLTYVQNVCDGHYYTAQSEGCQEREGVAKSIPYLRMHSQES